MPRCSKEFRSDQACFLRNLSREGRKAWLERNRFNLTKYCRVPEHVFMGADVGDAYTVGIKVYETKIEKSSSTGH